MNLFRTETPGPTREDREAREIARENRAWNAARRRCHRRTTNVTKIRRALARQRRRMVSVDDG